MQIKKRGRPKNIKPSHFMRVPHEFYLLKKIFSWDKIMELINRGNTKHGQ